MKKGPSGRELPDGPSSVYWIFKPVLLKLVGISGRVIGLDHVDREAVILTGVGQSVCDISFGLAVALDIFHVQVQDLVIVLQLGQIGGVQEVVSGIEDIQPDFFAGASDSLSWLLKAGLGAVASRKSS